MDTAGFYKFDGELLYAPNFVFSKDYELLKESKDTYTYPVDGWTWFNSLADANTSFGIDPKSEATTNA